MNAKLGSKMLVDIGYILPVQIYNVQLISTDPAHRPELDMMVNSYTVENKTIQELHVLIHNLMRHMPVTWQDVRHL